MTRNKQCGSSWCPLHCNVWGNSSCKPKLGYKKAVYTLYILAPSACGFPVLLNRVRLIFSTLMKLDFIVSLAWSHTEQRERKWSSYALHASFQSPVILWTIRWAKANSPTHHKHKQHRRGPAYSTKLFGWPHFGSVNLQLCYCLLSVRKQCLCKA